jgi:uncharacterized protein YkwD
MANIKMIVKCVIFSFALGVLCRLAYAQVQADYTLPDGTRFDCGYYAQQNTDVVAVVGNSDDALAEHYWKYGIAEGRLPYNGAADVSAGSVIALVNAYRSAQGVSLLKQDAMLMEEAQRRAAEMAETQCFSHTRPNGQRWHTAFKQDGFYTVAGENLARGSQSTAISVVEAWKRSAEHNTVLLHAKATRVGVGVAKGADGKFYFALTVTN